MHFHAVLSEKNVISDRNSTTEKSAYFAPLSDLDVGEAKLYLGLVHHTDGVAGARRRLATARKYVTGCGIATECGFGGRPQETIPELLRIHREVAAAF